MKPFWPGWHNQWRQDVTLNVALSIYLKRGWLWEQVLGNECEWRDHIPRLLITKEDFMKCDSRPHFKGQSYQVSLTFKMLNGRSPVNLSWCDNNLNIGQIYRYVAMETANRFHFRVWRSSETALDGHFGWFKLEVQIWLQNPYQHSKLRHIQLFLWWYRHR